MHEEFDQAQIEQLEQARIPLARRHLTILFGLAAAGILIAALGGLLVENAWQRFWAAYLVAFAFLLSISLGCLFFVLVQHLTRAGWSVLIRRPAEVLALNLILLAVLFVPIAWTVLSGSDVLYFWAKPDSAAHETVSAQRVIAPPTPTEQVAFSTVVPRPSETAILEHESESGHAAEAPRKPYLSRTRFLVSWTIYFSVWIGIAVFYFSSSIRQDKTRNVQLTKRMEWCSGICAVLFAFALTYASFDLLMSLDPIWYSTIFGVYFFAGCAVAGLASLLLIILTLKRLGIAPDVISDEVQRDLGRLLFAFVFFWAYIAFSQYMLLWYANVPETTGWLVRRGMSTASGYTNSWGWLVIVLLVAHFVIPFVGIMSRHVKSNSAAMIFWTIWLLLVHFADLYWIVIPQWHPQLTISLVEIGVAVTMIALYLISAGIIAARCRLIPVGDPRLNESLSARATY